MTMDFNTQQGQQAATQASLIGGPVGAVAALAAWVKDMQTGLSQQGKFEVDPERLPQLKADLDAVYQEAEAALDEANELQSIEPPALDDVSVQSVTNIKKVIEDGDGSLIKTCEDIILWIQSFKKEVETAIADYQRIDDENRMA